MMITENYAEANPPCSQLLREGVNPEKNKSIEKYLEVFGLLNATFK